MWLVTPESGGRAEANRSRRFAAALLRTGEDELRIAWLSLALLFAACADDEPVVRRSARASDARSLRPAPARAEPLAMPLGGQMRSALPAEASMAPANAEALASPDPAERERAVLDFEGDLALLAPLTDDASVEVRRAAVQRLAEAERPSERAALRRSLDDAEPSIVVEAILALGALDDAQAIPSLERLRVHPDGEVRALAEDTLESLRR